MPELKLDLTSDNSQAIDASREYVRQLRNQEDAVQRLQRLEADTYAKIAKIKQDAAGKGTAAVQAAAAKEEQLLQEMNAKATRIYEDAEKKKVRAAEDAAIKAANVAARESARATDAAIRESARAATAQAREAQRAAQEQDRAARQSGDALIREAKRAADEQVRQAQRTALESAKAAQQQQAAQQKFSADIAKLQADSHQEVMQGVQSLANTAQAAAVAALGAATAAAKGYISAMKDAKAEQDKLVDKGFDLQAGLRQYAAATGRTNNDRLLKEATKFMASTGLKDQVGVGFMTQYAGATQQYSENLAPGESRRLREMVGSLVAQQGGDTAYSEGLAQLSGQLLARGKGQTAEGIFAEIAAVTKILNASGGDQNILMRELMQKAPALVGSGQLKDYREAAAVTASAGNINGGTAGTTVVQSLRAANDRKSKLFQTAGLAEGMGGIERLERIYGAMDAAKGQGRDLDAWLQDQDIDSAEERLALMGMAAQRQSLQQGLATGRAAPSGTAAMDAVRKRMAADPSLVRDQAIARKASADIQGTSSQREFDVIRKETEARIAEEGRGQWNFAARGQRYYSSLLNPAALLGGLLGGMSPDQYGYEKEVLGRSGALSSTRGMGPFGAVGTQAEEVLTGGRAGAGYRPGEYDAGSGNGWGETGKDLAREIAEQTGVLKEMVGLLRTLANPAAAIGGAVSGMMGRPGKPPKSSVR